MTLHRSATVTLESTKKCPIAKALEVVGEKWTLLILRDLVRDITRFNDLEKSLGCPRNLLSKRLQDLQREGLITAESYRESGQRTRKQYRLTEKGQTVIPVLAALQQWALEHYPAETEIPADIEALASTQHTKTPASA